ncbi:hypothetical protein [Streptomyces anulatus]|uniref:hypothetical protein n=1 Tax=Streptomyces anulatus TaxID=1892 RepID=UPI003864B18E|nr:hypothetical protein OG865_27850 [Streptomyces anulatus]
MTSQGPKDVNDAERFQGLVASEIAGLAASVYRAATSRARLEDRPLRQTARLLGQLRSIRIGVDNLRAILVTNALAAGTDRDDLARWLGGSRDELEGCSTDWVRGQLAGAYGTALSAEASIDFQEAYRDGQLSAEQSEHYRALSDEVMEMLALVYMWKCDAQEATWLPERIRRAIEQGWFVQPKRAASSKDADAPSDKPAVVAVA